MYSAKALAFESSVETVGTVPNTHVHEVRLGCAEEPTKAVDLERPSSAMAFRRSADGI
jgi:hypothetical protein